MRRTHRSRTGGTRAPGLLTAALALCALLWPAPLRASSREYIPVGDPLEDELRVLDLLDSRPLAGRLRLSHLGLRPVQRWEVEGDGTPPETLDTARRISVARLERALGRDAAPGFEPDPRWPATPRLLELKAAGDERFDFSAALEGGALADTGDTRALSGTGLHGRFGVQVDRWLFFSHLVTGRVEQARTFADPIVPHTDLIVYTDETYIAYDGPDGRWGMQFGRGRWHWGPGEEASLTLSKTSAPISGLSYQVHLAPLHLDASVLSATLRQAAGEQLAAHRVEWQPRDGLRLGLTETARYKASIWQPLYAIGAIPYILVQRLLVQDEPDSASGLRNNIMLGVDAAWRIADGTRVYGELLVDDLHARSGHVPNKYGWQLGWEGVGTIGPSRVTWGGELTRLTRYVYTSYFGRTYEAQGAPLGFPTGPDARRVSLRAAWDAGPAWQVLVRASRTDQGENGLDEPYVPGSPRVSVERFEGVVERARDLEAGLRWWPAGGVDLRVLAGYRWIENEGHVAGRSAEHARAAFELRLVR